jgi:hypothetical protein
MQVTVDKSVSGQEVPGLSGGFEPLHLPLSSSRRPMCAIVQISALSVLHARKQPTLSRSLSVTITRGTSCKLFSNRLKKHLAPASDRLAGRNNAALNQDQLNIPQAEAEHLARRT